MEGTPGPAIPLAARIAALDWEALSAAIDDRGFAVTPPLLAPADCAQLAGLYGEDEDGRFRRRVVMEQHGYGQGEYRYFAYPLPPLVQDLREHLYTRLAPIARRWQAALGGRTDLPDTHRDYLALCHTAGQTRPTPLLLRYGPGDYNRLHQDLYGEIAFPLQAVFLLSVPVEGDSRRGDFEGGEFVLIEQRPRMQPRAEVVPFRQGEAVIFAVNVRPMQGKRGPVRVMMRHGVSRLRRGHRTTLGIIFHDAK